jgi:hypothetical protein
LDPVNPSKKSTSNVTNLAERRKAKAKKAKPKVDTIAIRAKNSFNDIMTTASTMEDSELRDYIMLVFADLTVLILNAEFFDDAPKALKRGIDMLEKDYGPEAQS